MQNLVQLALHVNGGDLLAANCGDGVGTIAEGSAAHAGDEVSEHAETDDSQQDTHCDLDPAISFQVPLLNASQHNCL